jgi:hypothetical protein
MLTFTAASCRTVLGIPAARKGRIFHNLETYLSHRMFCLLKFLMQHTNNCVQAHINFDFLGS